MARCEDCYHYEICAKQSRMVRIDEHTWDTYEEELEGVEKLCEQYIPTADVVPKSEDGILPCKIGDTAYAIKTNYHSKRVHSGKVSEMYYVGEEMKLCIVVKSVGRGEWGKDVFGTYEEAERSLQI